MQPIKNPFELYKLLPASNCRQCLLPSCMAFAVAVVQGTKKPQDCPYMPAQVRARCQTGIDKPKSLEDEQRQVIAELKKKVATLDFAALAPRLGARLINGSLAIPCLGKDFVFGPDGAMSSECHCNTWVMFPLLHYILFCQGRNPSGNWTAFAELAEAGNWRRYFGHRCEDALRQLADAHTDLVFEILDLFGAEPAADNPAGADHALVLHPLPKIPLLINYWRPEDGFDSKLNILFDRTADKNLPSEPTYMLCRGIVEMLRVLIVRHSRDGKLF